MRDAEDIVDDEAYQRQNEQVKYEGNDTPPEGALGLGGKAARFRGLW